MYIYHETTGIAVCSLVKECKKNGMKQLHWHDNLELVQVISDTICNFLVNGQIVSAKKGDIIVFPEKSLHRFHIENDTTMRIIQFPVKLIFESSHLNAGIKPHIKAEEIEKIPHLQQSIDYLCEIADNEYEQIKDDNPVLGSVISALYFLLARYFPEKSNTDTDRSERNSVYKVAKYINDNYKSDINAKKIAGEFCRSRGRLADAFKKYTGISIGEYINELRIKNTINLLKDGVRIGEAAFESGFQSLRSFNGVFKKYMGVTPTEYIKCMKPK